MDTATDGLRAVEASPKFLLVLTAIAFMGEVESADDRLLQPTLVKLDYTDRPVAQVVRFLAVRTGTPPDPPAVLTICGRPALVSRMTS